jgi:hypothetical protein
MNPLTSVLAALHNSANRGDLLERVAHATLAAHGFENVQRQLSGTQFGFDIAARLRNSEGDHELWKIECKNLQRPVGMHDLAPKLIWHLHPSLIDHYLLIATSPLTNDLRHFLENNPLPFPVTVWSEEVFANFVLASPAALALLEIDVLGVLPQVKQSFPSTFLPVGSLRFDVLHQHDPPRQFAYFEEQGRVMKAFTDSELKLDLLFTNRGTSEALVTDITCRTLRYRRLENDRIVVQTKAKGLFEPEVVRFSPSCIPGGDVSLLSGKVFGAKARGVEMLRTELLDHAAPGYYELQFVAQVPSERRKYLSPVLPLVIRAEENNTCSLMVVGKHYDSPVERVLGLPEEDWDRVARRLPEGTVQLLGPSMHELAAGQVSPDKWQIRELVHTPGPDGSWLVPDVPPSELISLTGAVDEPLYSIQDCRQRVEGRSEWPQILDRQFSRRWRLMSKDEAEDTGDA